MELNTTEEELLKQTKKWLSKLDKEKYIVNKDFPELNTSIENMKAYIKDCKYFLKNEDYIRAFEAIVYAWGIYETLLHLKLLNK